MDKEAGFHIVLFFGGGIEEGKVAVYLHVSLAESLPPLLQKIHLYVPTGPFVLQLKLI